MDNKGKEYVDFDKLVSQLNNAFENRRNFWEEEHKRKMETIKMETMKSKSHLEV